MKKVLLIFLAFFSSIAYTNGQRTFQVGVGGGVTHYYGDLGNEPVVQWGSTQPGVAITIRNFIVRYGSSLSLYPAFSMEFRLSWNRLQYDETKPIGSQSGFDLQNYGRGISFRNDLFGASISGTYTYYQNKLAPLYRQGPAIFISAGIGAYYGKPKADLFRGDIDMANRYYFWYDGTIRDSPEELGPGNIIEKDGTYETNLADWMTEGAGTKSEQYSFLNVGFPIGLGFRQGISKSVTVSIEFTYYFFVTDFLDDVSDSYPTVDEINTNFPNDPKNQALALYISDPTGLGNSGYPGPATSQRGNPAYKDTYSFLNLEFSYSFQLKR
jgi:hypothetical protein